jgi:Ca-activated chloride channel family protein
MSELPYQSDAWLDAQLRDVAVPANLAGRLRRLAEPDDAELDAALRDVAVPGELLRRLRRGTAARPGWRSVAEMAVAATLIMAISLSYFGAAMGFLWTLDPAARPPRLASQSQQIELDLYMTGAPAPVQIAATSPTSPAAPEPTSDRPAVSEPSISLSEYDILGELSQGRVDGPRRVFGRLGQPTKVDPLLDSTLYRWGVFGAHNSFDELPELRKVRGWIPRGVDAPLVPGFDISFLIRFGLHPFVSPAVRPELRRSAVPLDVGTASYDLARRFIADGELPPPEQVRTEEFLAAIDYHFPQPARGAIELFAGGGPWPAAAGLHLLQVGVQARELAPADHRPTHLTLVVDTSSSMQWGGRLEAIRRALDRLIPELGPNDRLSLVAFSERARVVVEEMGPDDREALTAALESLAAEGSTNAGSGLRLGYALAEGRSGTADRTRRIVLITDGLAELDLGSVMRIERQLRDAAGRNLRLDTVDLGQKRLDGAIDPQLESFAKAGGGAAHRATDAREIFWTLREVLQHRSQLVASDVRLEVEFDPRTVTAYRLLGHEAKAIAGLMPADLEADFRAGQSGQALYVVRLKPGVQGRVAVAETTWREPATGQLRRKRRPIRTQDLAATLLSAPRSVQAAAVVAQTAELLRRSPFAQLSPNQGTLVQVRQLCDELDTRLLEWPSFREFVEMLERAADAKPYRGGARP